MEKLDYLIEYLLKENKNIKINETPSDEEAKKRLYRSLCNIREPRPIKEEYIEKYHFEDLYSASFYDFNTQEEKWAFWAKMIKLNRFDEEPLKLYQELLSLVKNKNYFVITTNVDGQFENAGFDTEKIFAVQGDYALLQCENACHNKTYNNKELEYLLSKWYFKIKIGV